MAFITRPADWGGDTRGAQCRSCSYWTDDGNGRRLQGARSWRSSSEDGSSDSGRARRSEYAASGACRDRLEGYSRGTSGSVRRASSLQAATRVTIVEACKGDEENTALRHLDDLTRYLTWHRINGGPRVILEQRGSGAAQLIRVAQEEGADLLVTGAYGHSRLGEWVFGGMTERTYRDEPDLLSHVSLTLYGR